MRIIAFILFALPFSLLMDGKQLVQPGSLPAPRMTGPTVPLSPGRVEQTINTGWTFNYFPQEDTTAGYGHPGFDDSRWPVVALPHTWSTYETTSELHPFIKNPSEKDDPYWWHGWGWYRKKFVVDRRHAGKKIFVDFDGVMKNCRLWLNGKALGDHKGGYASFYFDLTEGVQPGDTNTLVVAVSNRRDDPYRTPPMTAGNFNVYGGIYRDVRLVIKDKLYIPFQGSYKHEGGTFVTTPHVSAGQAVVRVRTWVKNEYDTPQQCRLRTTVTDSSHRVIQTLESRATIKPGELYAFDQTGKPIANPRLWSVESPYRYRVQSEVFRDRQRTDALESPLGFRYFEWNFDEKRLYLNGEKQHIHGTNRHQEYPWLGDAISKWLHERDLRDIRFNLHHNFLRTAHYAQDPCVYDLCDRYGIMVCEEVPNIKSIDFSEELQAQMVREMVRRDRNHPSILFWSVGNETNDAADSRWVREEDSTRIIHARHVKGNSAGDFAPHTDAQMDMENLLRCTVRGWYNEDVKNLAPPDNQDTGHEEHQHATARIAGASQRGRIDMGNGVMWIYADHGADREYTDNPLKHLNPKGWVDAYRVPKYIYHLWRANYAPEPVVFIHPHHWRSQYLGQSKDIVVDSNCESVELKVNGESVGTLRPDSAGFFTVTFKNVPVTRGTLTAEGRKNGKTVSHRVIMAGPPARIMLTASHPRLTARQNEVSIVTADIVDADGVHVYGATHPLTWKVSGPATLVGAAVYQSDLDKHEATEGAMYIDAPVSNVIRSTGQPGTITVRVRSGNLIAGTVRIEAQREAPVAASGIAEPALPMGRRVAVARNQAPAGTAKAAPREIREAQADLFLREKDEHKLALQVKQKLLEQNPRVDTGSVELALLTEVFTRHLLQNKGELVADDYNFSVARYHTSRQITRHIDARNLPEPFKRVLKNHYARRIIRQGAEVDVAQEQNRIDRIPAAGKLVWTGPPAAALKDAVASEGRDLTGIVAQVYPAFGKLSGEKQAEYLTYVASINPHLEHRAAAGGNASAMRSYPVPEGCLVLVPEPENAKKY